MMNPNDMDKHLHLSVSGSVSSDCFIEPVHDYGKIGQPLVRIQLYFSVKIGLFIYVHTDVDFPYIHFVK